MTMTKLSQIALLAITLTVPATKAVWGEEQSSRKKQQSSSSKEQASGKLDRSLQQAVRGGCSRVSQDVIIRATDGHRKGLRDSLKARGHRVTSEFQSINAVAAKVRCSDLVALARLSATASISADADMETHGNAPAGNHPRKMQSTESTPTQAEAAAQLQEPLFETTLAWKRLRAASYLGTTTTPSSNPLDMTLRMMLDLGMTGNAGGVGIGVIDSGIAPSPEFEDRVSAFYDFTNGAVHAAAPTDEFGHGSHVAGLIAGVNVGVAPGARLIGLKVLDSGGSGSASDVLRAIEFAVANKAALNLQVLNLSLGHPIYESAATDPLVQAVEHAVRNGLVVVVSAGNFGINRTTGEPGYAGIASPGNAPSALTTGATRAFDTVTRLDDRVAAYSSRGPTWYDGFAKPDVVAPGDNLLSVAAGNSTLRRAQELRGNTGEYMRLSGTSMAAGVTSGAVALVLGANPGLTPNALKAIMEYTAIPVLTDTGELADALTQGTGQINGDGAFTLASMIDANALVGSVWLTGGTITPTTSIGDTSYAWSQSVLWGNRKVYGENLMTEQRTAWSANIVWGEGLGSEDDNIVWGNRFADDDNIVWGNMFDNGDNIVWGNNVVWGNRFADDDNIVWGNRFEDDDNIVWGNRFADDDNIVWGNNIVWGSGLIGMRSR